MGPRGGAPRTMPYEQLTAGTELVPLQFARNPKVAGGVAFHDTFLTVTCDPVCVYAPFHTCVMVWPLPNDHVTVHPVLPAGAVTLTSPWKPVFHWLTILYVAVHPPGS